MKESPICKVSSKFRTYIPQRHNPIIFCVFVSSACHYDVPIKEVPGKVCGEYSLSPAPLFPIGALYFVSTYHYTKNVSAVCVCNDGSVIN